MAVSRIGRASSNSYRATSSKAKKATANSSSSTTSKAKKATRSSNIATTSKARKTTKSSSRSKSSKVQSAVTSSNSSFRPTKSKEKRRASSYEISKLDTLRSRHKAANLKTIATISKNSVKSNADVTIGNKKVGNAHVNNGVTTGNIRDIVEGLGGSVSWNEKTREATVKLNEKTIIYDLDTKKDSNGNTFTVSEDGHIQVGVREMAKAAGVEDRIKWTTKDGNVKVVVEMPQNTTKELDKYIIYPFKPTLTTSKDELLKQLKNPELWLNDIEQIDTLVALKNNIKNNGEHSIWDLNKKELTAIYKAFNLSAEDTSRDFMIEMFQAVRDDNDLTSKKGNEYIDVALMDAIIYKETTSQMSETWKKRVSINLQLIKADLQNKTSISFSSLSDEAKRSVQYAIGLKATGWLDRDTQQSLIYYNTEYANPSTPDYSIDSKMITEIMSTYDRTVAKRSEIGELLYDTQAAQLFYEAVTLWAAGRYMTEGVSNSVKLPDTTFTTKKLQHEFKHAGDFGVKGNWNKATCEAYQKAIQNHIDTATDVYKSTYRGEGVYVYINKNTRVGAYTDLFGNYVGGWKFSTDQMNFHLTMGTKIK